MISGHTRFANQFDDRAEKREASLSHLSEEDYRQHFGWDVEEKEEITEMKNDLHRWLEILSTGTNIGKWIDIVYVKGIPWHGAIEILGTKSRNVWGREKPQIEAAIIYLRSFEDISKEQVREALKGMDIESLQIVYRVWAGMSLAEIARHKNAKTSQRAKRLMGEAISFVKDRDTRVAEMIGWWLEPRNRASMAGVERDGSLACLPDFKGM